MGSESLPKMEYRFLGRSGLQVSAISLGGWLTYGGHVENGTFRRDCSTETTIHVDIEMQRTAMHV